MRCLAGAEAEADHQRLSDWEPKRVSDEGISKQQQQEPDLGGQGAQGE
jgi:hypothetical protein